MTGIVDQSYIYAVPPERLWALAVDLDVLVRICRPLIAFQGVPEGPVQQGQLAEVQCVWLFGLLLLGRYRMEVALCDSAAMRIESHEAGAGIRRWDHTIQIAPAPRGAQLHDRVEIDGSWRIPAVTAWGWVFYGYRHRAGCGCWPRRRAMREASYGCLTLPCSLRCCL